MLNFSHMQQYISFYLLLILILISTTFQSHGQNESWISIENESYLLTHPDSWSFSNDSTGFVEFWLYGKPDLDTCKVHICLNIDDLESTGKKAIKYFKTNKRIKEKIFNNYQVMHIEKTKTKGMRLYNHIFKYSCLIDENREQIEFVTTHYIYISKNTYYNLVFTSNLSEYSKFKDTGEQTLASFLLKN